MLYPVNTILLDFNNIQSTQSNTMIKQPFIDRHLQQVFMKSFTKNVIELSNLMCGSMIE